MFGNADISHGRLAENNQNFWSQTHHSSRENCGMRPQGRSFIRIHGHGTWPEHTAPFGKCKLADKGFEKCAPLGGTAYACEVRAKLVIRPQHRRGRNPAKPVGPRFRPGGGIACAGGCSGKSNGRGERAMGLLRYLALFRGSGAPVLPLLSAGGFWGLCLAGGTRCCGQPCLVAPCSCRAGCNGRHLLRGRCVRRDSPLSAKVDGVNRAIAQNMRQPGY